MQLRRVQAFEFNDQPWVPAVLRDTIVESLSLALAWGGILEGLAEPLSTFLRDAGSSRVLDIGAGGGGPASVLIGALARRGLDVEWTLTDLFPRAAVWQRLADRHGGELRFVAEPVDATAIDPQLSEGRVRTIINVLHHLPAPVARGVLRDAIASRAPIFIAEGFERSPIRFASFAPFGLPALAASPVLAPGNHLARALIAWATPIALLASIWDGLVSTLRVYTEAELREMVAPEGDVGAGYRWTYGHYTWTPFGKGYYFCGLPG